MKRFFLLLFLFVLLYPVANGQLWKLRRYEIYGGLGTAQIFGDIGGYSIGENAWGLKDLMINQTRINIKLVCVTGLLKGWEFLLTLTMATCMLRMQQVVMYQEVLNPLHPYLNP